MSSTLYKMAFLLLATVIVAGCGDGGLPTMADLNNSNIRRLHSCYTMYMNSNQNTAPKNEAELKDFLLNNNTAKVLIGRMEITPEMVPGIFISERDEQPFKVKWGVKGIADHAIVFEAEGVDGKRMVAFSRPRELDDTEYQGYWDGSIKPNAPGGDADMVELDKSGTEGQ